MQVEIREAAPSDLPALEIVRRQAIEAGFTDEHDRNDFADLVARADPSLREWITSEGHLAMLGETAVTVVCYGVLDRREGAVEALYTAPEYQDHGCAGVLLDRFERAMREEGGSSLAVTSPPAAVGFFERFGFERTGADRRDGLRFVTMAKAIGDGDVR